jgi:hypothetical protein
LDEIAKEGFTVRVIEMIFKMACAECFPGLYVRPLRGKSLKLTEQMLKDVPIGHLGRILVVVVRNWTDFVCFAGSFGDFVQPRLSDD